MPLEPLFQIALVIVLGVGAQWLAWSLRIPSIIMLLVVGFVAGATKVIDAHASGPFGEMLVPIVSISVGLILYEGGLSLRFVELKGVANVVWALVTVGAAITWAIAGGGAYWLLGMEPRLAILLGAILVVTGPTVVGPLLRHIRPTGAVGPVLKWEGIVIDPIGAMLAVLVFEAIAHGGPDAGNVAMGMTRTVVIGGGLGVGFGIMLALLLRAFLIPGYLENAVSVMLVVLVFGLSNYFQEESGLLATTVMGITLANQKLADVRHILEFKENLQVLLISTLFILLSARLRPESLAQLDWRDLVFLLSLVFLARPLAVLASTTGSRLSRRQRVFMAWMAPRGIVAAAVASVFALQLEPTFSAETMDLFVARTFVVIIGTVLLYGLTAPLVARRLGVADPSPQGVLLVGGHQFSRAVAEVLKKHGFRVLLVDTNRNNVRRARMGGLEIYADSILAEHALDEIELGGLGRLIAATPNDWVNALAVQRFVRIFGRGEVYQLAPPGTSDDKDAYRHLHGRWLFDQHAGYQVLERRMRDGAIMKSTTLSEEFDWDSYREHYGERAIPLFIITESKRLTPIVAEHVPSPKPGDTVISLADEEERAAPAPAEPPEAASR